MMLNILQIFGENYFVLKFSPQFDRENWKEVEGRIFQEETQKVKSRRKFLIRQ